MDDGILASQCASKKSSSRSRLPAEGAEFLRKTKKITFSCFSNLFSPFCSTVLLLVLESFLKCFLFHLGHHNTLEALLFLSFSRTASESISTTLPASTSCCVSVKLLTGPRNSLSLPSEAIFRKKSWDFI